MSETRSSQLRSICTLSDGDYATGFPRAQCRLDISERSLNRAAKEASSERACRSHSVRTEADFVKASSSNYSAVAAVFLVECAPQGTAVFLTITQTSAPNTRKAVSLPALTGGQQINNYQNLVSLT